MSFLDGLFGGRQSEEESSPQVGMEGPDDIATRLSQMEARLREHLSKETRLLHSKIDHLIDSLASVEDTMVGAAPSVPVVRCSMAGAGDALRTSFACPAVRHSMVGNRSSARISLPAERRSCNPPSQPTKQVSFACLSGCCASVPEDAQSNAAPTPLESGEVAGALGREATRRDVQAFGFSGHVAEDDPEIFRLLDGVRRGAPLEPGRRPPAGNAIQRFFRRQLKKQQANNRLSRSTTLRFYFKQQQRLLAHKEGAGRSFIARRSVVVVASWFERLKTSIALGLRTCADAIPVRSPPAHRRCCRAPCLLSSPLPNPVHPHPLPSWLAGRAP